MAGILSHLRERTGEIFTRVEFDREEKQAYALEVEARDGAASARPNANGRPNTGKDTILCHIPSLQQPYPSLPYLQHALLPPFPLLIPIITPSIPPLYPK